MHNQPIDPKKHEILKLHYKYLIVISAILLFGGIVLASADQTEFAAQVSFASTITSIILSVIAILMSLWGERTTNEIKTSITESAERLSGYTKEIGVLNNSHKETMDKQLDELKNVQEQLTQVIQSIGNVEKQVSSIYHNNTNPGTIGNAMKSSQGIQLFRLIYSWATTNDYSGEWIFCKITEFVIQKHSQHHPFYFNEMTTILAYNNININLYWNSINIYWGIINTLLAASVFDDADTLTNIYKIVNEKLYPALNNNLQ